MILDTTSRSLQVVLGEATTTTACDVITCFAQATPTTFVPSTTTARTTGTTPVVNLPAPPYGIQFLVNEVRVYNNDTIVHKVTLQLVDGAFTLVVMSQTVAIGGHFTYTPVVVPSP